MKLSLDKFQIFVLIGYLFFNTYALFYLLYYERTFSEFNEPATDTNLIFLSYLGVIGPFLFFSLYVYPLLQNKFKGSNYKNEISIRLQTKVAIFVLVLQVLFLIYNLITGVNSAGSTIKTDSPIKFIFIILSPDIFFLILYGFARKNKYFKYNLMIYLISNIQRGWMGGIFFIIVLELYIYFKKYGFSKRIISIFLIFGFVTLSLLPYIVALKWGARVYFGGLSNNLLNELQVVLTLGNQPYIDSLLESISYLFGRFQILSNVYLVIENINTLINLKEKNEFVSVFSMGLPQLLFHKIAQLEYITLDSYFVSLIGDYTNNDISWNTHLGWIGWIIPQPELFTIYFFYSCLLIFLVLFFTKYIGGEYLFFISWFMTVVLLLQGWIQAYIGYLLGLITFFIIKVILKKFKIQRRTNETKQI